MRTGWDHLGIALGLTLGGVGCLWAPACGGSVGAESGSVPERDSGNSSSDGGGGGTTGRGRPAAGASGHAQTEASFLLPTDPAEVTRLRDNACASMSNYNEPLPKNVLLAVDMSESMLTSTPVTNGRSKWEVIRNSVASAVENWPDLTVVGMLLFPNVATSPSTVELDPEACVAIDSLLPLQLLDVEQQRETLLAALSDTEPVPPAATPLHDAYATAVEALTTIPQYGTDHVMLITDGQPTLSRGCVGPGELGSPVDAQPIIDEIRSAQVDLGVFTWVVGTPGSEADVAAGLDARPWLSAAAEAGGTASPNCSHSGPTYCHLDLSGEADFAAALTETMLPPVCHPSVCSISIPVQPDDQRIDFNEITILVFPANEDQGYILQHGREGECGWYADPDTMRIEICPAACQWLADDCTPHVEILLACSTITPR